MSEENERDHRILAGIKEGPADCKTIQWYKKVVLHFLDMAMTNAFLVYHKHKCGLLWNLGKPSKIRLTVSPRQNIPAV